MASVSFVLKEPSSKEETLVYLLFRFNNNRLKFSTGEKILPKFWNPEKQRAKESKQFLEFPEFNSVLDNQETAVKNVYRRLLNDGVVPTVPRIKLDLIKELKRDQPQEKLTFFKFIEGLIQNSSKKPVTVKNYKHALAKFKEYQKDTGNPVDFDTINLAFYHDFINYMNEKGYAFNTIGNLIKNIKVFMGEATDRGIQVNKDYLNRRFKVLQEHPETIYLSQAEILKLYELDLSQDKKLEKARDLFVVGCYTGLRISDLRNLSRENLINNYTQVKIKTRKTGETVIIPVHKLVRYIFDKYEGVLPKPTPNSNLMNNYLKEVALLAGLTEPILKHITRGGITVQETYLKYQLVSTHTARRSFATNLFLADIPSITIMKLTGHKTEKAFLRYIRLTQEQNADKLLNHPFFK